MASIWITWSAVVTQSIRIYVLLALLSFMASGIWQSMRLPVTTPQSLMIHFYQHALGHLDGRSCPSYPVCSLYARQALQKHGWLLGSWLSMDRLIHEHDDLKDGNKKAKHIIVFEGQFRLYDPLARNDFWLNKK